MKLIFPSFRSAWTIAVLATLLLFGCAGHDPAAYRSAPPCISKGWPQDRSDLPPDPALRFGVLDNGLRYVIMENHEPEDRVALYLNIQSGSLHETDSQRGYAHFLEHLLFNGSTHFPPGTLVEYFQSIGMSFGADSNAHTSLDETVYNLFLPDASPAHLDKGLLVLADYARGALLLEEEVERERGVILAEKRSRDSVEYRLYEQQMQASFAGTRVAERLPIGTEEALLEADSASLRAYYDAWYRPENMILVIVGDVQTEAITPLIARQFEGLAAPPAEPFCFEYGRIDEAAITAYYFREPKLGQTRISVTARWNTEPRSDSLAWQVELLKQYLATSLLNNRLKKLVSQPGSPLTKAENYAGIYLGRFGYASVSATSEGEKWQSALELLNTTLRQALESGFSEQELQRTKKEVMAELDRNMRTAGGRDSRKLASQIIDKLNRSEVFLSPEQDLELFGPVVTQLSLAEANDVFRALWAPSGREIMVAGTAEIAAGQGRPEDAIMAVFRESQTSALSAWENGQDQLFPYLEAPEQVPSPASHRNLVEIGTEQAVFSNGTVVNVKRTDFQPNEVLLSVQFGQGRLTEPKPGMALLAESVANESGVGKLTRTELDAALAGSSVELTFRAGQESFSLTGKGLSSELELLLQLAMTRLVDPAFRDEAFQLSRERFAQMYDQMENSVEGALQLQGERFLAGGSHHYGMPPRSEMMAIDLDAIRAWLGPIFTQGPLEVTVVGDVDPAEAFKLAGRYFGRVERSSAPAPAAETLRFPAGETLAAAIPSSIDKALLLVAWPTADFWDINRTRRLNILAEVLDDRLRVEIREKLGAAYSPAVYNVSSRVAAGYGVLRAMLQVDPARAEELAARVIAVAADLAASGVGEEELRRALEPSLTSIKDIRKTNRYWMESVLSLSSRHPEQLSWPLTIEEDFAAITAREISALAARHLPKTGAATVIIRPRAK